MSRLELTESERQNPYADYYYGESATFPDTVLENIHISQCNRQDV